MSVLDALDATRLCARWSEPLADPAVWARPIPLRERVERPVTPLVDYSLGALLRNPRALLLTGMLGPIVARDAVRGMFAH